ncbi:uncharacterized protein LOC120869344 [Oryx dammah]|uniref:uncharacterized protein LOC120869344 n=1 Tax=Oryx dammah TaxID=59534 RepID=UPI001A9C0B7D|nr:uncharacterized protein LOC120869344 [Oryx dammah]
MFQSSENRRKATSQPQSSEPKPRNTTSGHREATSDPAQERPRPARTRRLQGPGAGRPPWPAPSPPGEETRTAAPPRETRTLTSRGLLSLRHLQAGVRSGRSVRRSHPRAGCRPEAREALGGHLCCPRAQPPGLGFRRDPRFTTWGLSLSPGFTSGPQFTAEPALQRGVSDKGFSQVRVSGPRPRPEFPQDRAHRRAQGRALRRQRRLFGAPAASRSLPGACAGDQAARVGREPVHQW